MIPRYHRNPHLMLGLTACLSLIGIGSGATCTPPAYSVGTTCLTCPLGSFFSSTYGTGICDPCPVGTTSKVQGNDFTKSCVCTSSQTKASGVGQLSPFYPNQFALSEFWASCYASYVTLSSQTSFVSGGRLQLTPARANAVGSIVTKVPVSLSSSWTTTFSFVTSDSAPSANDGSAIAFVLSDDSAATNGNGDLAIVVDMFKTAAQPSRSVIGVVYPSYSAAATYKASYNSPKSLSSGRYTLRIQFDYATNVLKVYLASGDNPKTLTATPVITHRIPVANALKSKAVYPSLRARTSATAFQANQIFNWTFSMLAMTPTPGTVCNAGSSFCEADIGFEPSFDGTGQVRPCPLGTFKSRVGNTLCTLCAPGLTTPSPGTTSSALCGCNAGSYYDPAKKLCISCPVGTYQSSFGPLTSCARCPNTQTTLLEGATSVSQCVCENGGELIDEICQVCTSRNEFGDCIKCPVGTFVDSTYGSKICTKCPVGTSSSVQGEDFTKTCKCSSSQIAPKGPNQLAPFYPYQMKHSEFYADCHPAYFTRSSATSFVSGGRLQLTPALPNQNGAFVSNYSLPLSSSWSVTFAFGTPTADTVKGSSISFAVSSTNNLDPTKDNDILAVIIDTHKDVGQSSGNVIGISYPRFNDTGAFAASLSQANLFSLGRWIVRVHYNSTNDEISVFVAQGDQPSLLPDKPSLIYKIPNYTLKRKRGYFSLRAKTAPNFAPANQIYYWSFSTFAPNPPKGMICNLKSSFCEADIGYEPTFDGTGQVRQCPVGTYKSSVENVPCTPCGQGMTTQTIGSTSLDQCGCQAGQYYTKRNGCVNCDIGYYKAAWGDQDAQCVACVGGQTTSNTGTTNIAQCLCPGSSRLNADNQCETCYNGLIWSDNTKRCVNPPPIDPPTPATSPSESPTTTTTTTTSETTTTTTTTTATSTSPTTTGIEIKPRVDTGTTVTTATTTGIQVRPRVAARGVSPKSTNTDDASSVNDEGEVKPIGGVSQQTFIVIAVCAGVVGLAIGAAATVLITRKRGQDTGFNDNGTTTSSNAPMEISAPYEVHGSLPPPNVMSIPKKSKSFSNLLHKNVELGGMNDIMSESALQHPAMAHMQGVPLYPSRSQGDLRQLQRRTPQIVHSHSNMDIYALSQPISDPAQSKDMSNPMPKNTQVDVEAAQNVPSAVASERRITRTLVPQTTLRFESSSQN